MEESRNKKTGWNWAEHKPNNALTITPTPDKNFFKWWCVMLHPFVDLTPREEDVLAAYLRQRQELKKVISDPVALDSYLMGNDVKFKVIAECGITLQNYYVVMGNLKRKKVITDAGITPILIPNFKSDEPFMLLVLFNKEEKDDL
jgi:hypothetical protein